MAREPSKPAKVAIVVAAAVVSFLVVAIVVGALIWVAQTIWGAVL